MISAKSAICKEAVMSDSSDLKRDLYRPDNQYI